MQLYYIRHAESKNNRIWTQNGYNGARTPDPQLTALGQRQAQRLAQFIRSSGNGVPPSAFDLQNAQGFGFTHIYCSLMTRAVETGLPLARALQLPLVGWLDLHETGGIYHHAENGEEPVGLPGKTRAYFEGHYPELRLPAGLPTAGWWARPFEKPAERPRRARRVLKELLARHGGTEDSVALISHGGFFNYLLAVILELPSRAEYRFFKNNVSITRIDFLPEATNIVYLNRLDFLPPDMTT